MDEYNAFGYCILCPKLICDIVFIPIIIMLYTNYNVNNEKGKQICGINVLSWLRGYFSLCLIFINIIAMFISA